MYLSIAFKDKIHSFIAAVIVAVISSIASYLGNLGSYPGSCKHAVSACTAACGMNTCIDKCSHSVGLGYLSKV